VSPNSKRKTELARAMKQAPINFVIRAYQLADFDALYELDQQCFPRGIAYSKSMLRYFLQIAPETCFVAATEEAAIAGFILGEVDRPLAHIITIDIAEVYRRSGIGSQLLDKLERKFQALGVETVVIETAVNNAAGIAFWQRHGYQTTRRLKKYYLGRTDAHEMRKPLAT
jgi:ribosomal-protein-alanine N-acetyltransferase